MRSVRVFVLNYFSECGSSGYNPVDCFERAECLLDTFNCNG